MKLESCDIDSGLPMAQHLCGRRAFKLPTVWNSLLDLLTRDPTISADCFRHLYKSICSLDASASTVLGGS